MSDDPYAAPEYDLLAQRGSPELWNPEAAAAWSILLTPLFGTALVWLNWRAMEEPGRANLELLWLGGALVHYVVASQYGTWYGLPVLLVWYLRSCKPQHRRIYERWGLSYARRGWTVPVVVGLVSQGALAWGLAPTVRI